MATEEPVKQASELEQLQMRSNQVTDEVSTTASAESRFWGGSRSLVTSPCGCCGSSPGASEFRCLTLKRWDTGLIVLGISFCGSSVMGLVTVRDREGSGGYLPYWRMQ